jgi:hypothetical protein
LEFPASKKEAGIGA